MLFPPTENKNTPILENLIKKLTTDIDQQKRKIPLNTLEFTSSYYPNFILLEKIKPDAYVRKKTTKGITHGLFFVLDAYAPRVMLQYFIKRTFTTLQEEYWETDDIAELEVISKPVILACPESFFSLGDSGCAFGLPE